MTAIQLLACAGMIVGVFLILKITPMEFTDELFDFLLKPKRSIREEIKVASGRKKRGVLRKELEEAQAVLQMTGRGNRFSVMCAEALALFCIGGAIAILLGNFLLAPVMAMGFLLLPIWYVKLTANHYKRDVSEELETALSVITTAYLRTEDIMTAAEENLTYLNPPVSRVFQDFLTQIKLVNPDVVDAIKRMRGRIDNEVFREWCDAVCDCQNDRSLKTTLPSIVAKLSDMRIVNAELEYMIAEPRKEFLIMVVFVVGNIPLMYFLNKDWYDVLMHTLLGQFILAVTAAAIFVSTGFVIKLTRPIEYRR